MGGTVVCDVCEFPTISDPLHPMAAVWFGKERVLVCARCVAQYTVKEKP